MMRYLPAVVAVVAIVVTGLVHGFWTDRWTNSTAVNNAIEQMNHMPMMVGDWLSQQEGTVATQADGTASLERRYLNPKTGEVLSVCLICGRPGPVSIHTPDVCYGASGYNVGDRRTLPVDTTTGKAEVFTADAVKHQSANSTRLRIFWSWLATDQWVVADNPRLTFARQPVLYKFYVLREVPTSTEVERDPSLDFVRQMLPALKQSLSGTTP